MALIQAVKLPSTAVARLLFWFGLLASFIKGLSVLNIEKVIRKKWREKFLLLIFTLIQWFHR